MVVVFGTTIWLLGAAWLLFQLLPLPPWYPRAAMTLLCAELLALLVRSYSDPDGIVGRAAGALAAVDVPALGGLLYVLAVAYGLRAHRRAARVTTRSRSAR
jgi:hypothetical protein